MANGVKYVIMTLVFLGLVKLLQVTSFDGKKYESMTKDREAQYVSKLAKKGDKKAQKLGIKKDTTKKKITNTSSTNKPVEKSKTKADKALEDLKTTYLKPILKKLPPDGLRKDIFIRYYRHDKDGIGVYKLEEMGYYMHQKQATETAGLGSNVIYYGDDVPLEDIQIVALTLLKEQIPLKKIEHTKFEWKSSAIEIGTDTSIPNDQPNISIEEILDFDKKYLGGY